jgi:hypothetical protein
MQNKNAPYLRQPFWLLIARVPDTDGTESRGNQTRIKRQPKAGPAMAPNAIVSSTSLSDNVGRDVPSDREREAMRISASLDEVLRSRSCTQLNVGY